jgi:hypothetical protein
MKKSGFFLVLFSLLASAVWGQNTYVWAGYSDTVNPGGDHNWFTPANWQVNGSTATTYPGDGNRTADIAVFDNAISGSAYINIQDEFTLGELQINANVQLAFRNWKGGANTYYDINVTNLVLNGRLTADRVGWDDGTNSNIFDPANQGVVYIQNLTSSNGEFTSVNCTIGLGNLSTPASFAQLTIAPGMVTVHAGNLINGANNSITAGGITMGGALNGGGNLSLNGTVTISAALGGTTALGSLNVTGPVVLNANVTTSGVQTYNGTVQLGVGARTLTGSTVTLGTITGGGYALTIAGSAVLAGGNGIGALQINGTGNTAVINGNITNTTSVTINATGTATINANINTTGTGTPQRYYGPVVLGANVTFTAPANSTVRFDGTVNSDGTARSLTVATAILRFSALVGSTAPLSTVTATGAGNHRLVVGVTTTGNQTYGIVRLGNTANTSVTLAAGAGTITFGAGGAIGSNNTTAHALTITSGNVVFNGAVGAAANPISTLTINGSGTTTFNAAVTNTASVAINSTGTANINANVTTTGTTGTVQLYHGPVVLGANVTFTGGNNNRTIQFDSTVNGDTNARTLTIATASASFNGAVGGGTGLGSVSVAGTSAINANVTTTGAQTYTGAVTLGANVNLTANAGSQVTFSNTVNGDNTTRTLTITTANVQFNGAVGGGIQPSSITVNGGTITQGATAPIATPSLSINSASAITLTNANNAVGALTITGTGNQAVQFTNNANLSIAGINRANSAVTITNGANISIDGAINSASLALLADTGDVAVHSNISVSGTNETHTVNAAVYIRAASFSGTGGINLTSANGWACAEISSNVSYSGSVTLDGAGKPRIHFHAPAGRHIVYRTGNDTGSYTGIVGAYLYLRADTALGGNNITYSTTGTGNVYIIDVGNVSPANARTVNFSTATGGYIEIRGAYTSSGALNLTPGTGGIRLDTAVIDLTGANSTFDTYTPSVPLTLLNGSNSIKTTDIIELGNVTAQNNSNLDLNAITAVRLRGATGTAASSLGAITVTSQYLDLYGTTSIHARDAILFNLSVHTNLGGTPTLVSTTSNITLNSAFIGGGGLTMTAGGNITISGQVGGSSPIALIGNISATAVGVTFHEINAGSVTVNNSGLYTQNGPVNAGGVFDQTGSGAVSLANNITAVSSNRNNAVIRFNSAVNITPVAGATLAVPTTGGTVHLALGASGNTLILEGGSAGAHLTFEQGGTLENVTVIQDSYVSLGTTGNAVSQNAGRTLTLQPGATLDTSAGSWHIGGSLTPNNDFAGVSGNLTLGAESRLMCNELNLTGTPFTVNNTGWAYVSVKGNANISAAVNSGNINPQLILEMSGNVNQNITTAQALGSLHIKPGSHTHLTADLIIKGEVQIEYPGILDAGLHNIEMRAGLSGTKNGASAKVGRWITINAPVPVLPTSSYTMNAFQQEPGKSVTFKKELTADTNVYFEIIGQTVWQKFICKEPGAVIQFSTHPDQHMFLDTFEIEGATGGTNYSNYVTLTRLPPQDNPRWSNPGWVVNPEWIFIYDGTTPPNPAKGIPSAPPPADLKTSSESYYFWNFNLVTPAHGQRLLEIKYATIYFSHAWNQRIPIDPDTMFLWAIPYFKGPPNEGYFNYDWIRVRKIVYSFVEDSNGNGKLDRIRVQTNVNLNGVFDRFDVAVEGYRVDKSRGVNNSGFATVYSITNDANDQASFYIYIEEPPWLYDGSTITWWVTENRDSLKDIATQTQLIGEPGNGEYFKTTNTIPPRISYALTLPGHNQTYVRMSQPVTVTGPLTVGGNRITDPDAIAPVEGTQGHTVQLEYRFFDETVNRYPFLVPAGTLGYLLELDDSPSVFDLAFLPRVGAFSPENFTMQGMITDLGVRALDWHDILIDADSYLYYPSPRYPIDWNYSKYANFSGNGHIAGLSPDAPTGNPNPQTGIFLPPNRLLTPQMMTNLESGGSVTPSLFNYTVGDTITRRSTDVLVSRPPSSTDYENYFAWPVWARYSDTSSNPGLLNAGNSFWGQQNTDSGIIWAFDGSKFLEAHDITLQIRVNEDQLPSVTDLNLYFAPNVPAELRNPSDAGIRGRTSGGLWLPAPPESITNPLFDNPLFNISATRPRPGGTNGHLLFYPALQQTPSSTTGPLFVFNLEGVTSGVRMDFLIRLEGTSSTVDPYLFIARLDAPAGVVPSDWWRRVRPFSFDIQDVRMQRGGVAILNNVINSDAREVARIRYNLVRPGRVTIQVYTLDGTLVKSIRRNEYRDIGEWDDMWDGTNNGGRAVARGMYFVRVVAPDIDEIREIMVIK